MPGASFERLPAKPDHPRLELEVLDLWEQRGTFERVRERNRGGPRWSFIDGPVTANKILAVHTAWGRTLKDVFQRYRAMRGFDQRYQNGFDCQGLWIEVGVERELGFNSKREIESYGLAEFARRCREKVVWSAEELTRGSKRLGQWMDWGADYFTFSDTNIEYIWRFLKIVHERGWLYTTDRATEWCPRCGTSISQHELLQADVYRDRTDPSLFVRFPLRDRPGESLVVWTTTPWTLPANVAAAVNPDAEYVLRDGGEWVARARHDDGPVHASLPGRELVGLAYDGPFDHLPPAAGVEHRVIPWDEVSLEEGTGIVHIAPGCGGEDFELSQTLGLDVLAPVDEAGRFFEDYGWLHGRGTGEVADQIVADLSERGRIVAAEEVVHRYPHCWRCQTPLIFRLSEDWFIAVDEVRPRALEANAAVRWTPDYMGRRMDDWLRNMDDWNISRKRFYGLPLPFYPCACGHLNVIGSRAELERRATRGLDQLEELRRPWVDDVPIRCEACGERGHPDPRGRRRLARRRDRALLHPRLGEPGVDRGRLRDRRRARALAGGPSRPRLLGAVVPGRLGLGDARADPAVVLLAALHVGRPDRPGPVPRGPLLREDGRRARPRDARLVGQPDRGRGRLRAHGRRRHALAVLRPAAEPEPALRLRPGAADQAQAADAVELGVVLRRVREHRGLPPRARRSRPRSARRGFRSTAGSSPARRTSSRRRRRATTRRSRSRSSAPTRRSSTTSRTGTSAAPAAASGAATARRSRRSGTRSCSRCG